MILADTNILIDFWKSPDPATEKIFRENEISTCGVIKAELLRGCNSENQMNKINKALDCFEYYDFEESDWQPLAELFIKLKKSGLSVPFRDAMISILAIKNACPLWTKDRHFCLIKEIVPELELF